MSTLLDNDIFLDCGGRSSNHYTTVLLCCVC